MPANLKGKHILAPPHNPRVRYPRHTFEVSEAKSGSAPIPIPICARFSSWNEYGDHTEAQAALKNARYLPEPIHHVRDDITDYNLRSSWASYHEARLSEANQNIEQVRVPYQQSSQGRPRQPLKRKDAKITPDTVSYWSNIRGQNCLLWKMMADKVGFVEANRWWRKEVRVPNEKENVALEKKEDEEFENFGKPEESPKTNECKMINLRDSGYGSGSCHSLIADVLDPVQKVRWGVDCST
ncbi:hypothetical protein K504DRAFT_459012 [Pleomassaria siparia CBS 279.74]|uniref:Uncharacterized protein n=1 Tax=Pleomassaria siparia CBS 279.74 TaxID=1314801 RepID=A0A6G1K185_9PLEO|nr:hypothetical protein K504DRAFT_459012 [Pleomassaria siparia CBS 279.74]